MKKPKTVDDKFFLRWEYDPNDRNANTVGLGIAGVEASISMVGEIGFRVRMRIPKALRTAGRPERDSKTYAYFRRDSKGEVIYGIDKALVDGMATRQRWRDELEGKPTVNEEDIPKVGGKDGLIERYFAARAEGKDDLLPKGLTVNWKKDKRQMELVYKTLAGRSCWHVSREDIGKAHRAYLDERFALTGVEPYSTILNTFNAAHIMFKWARDKYWMRPETLMGLKANVPKSEGRDRVLTPRELQLAYPAFDKLDVRQMRRRLATREDSGVLMRWIIATACRRSMAVHMQWGDLRTLNVGTAMQPKSLLVWCVPADKMKMNVTAMFPIVGESLRLIEMLRARVGNYEKSDYVFSPAARSDWGKNADKRQKNIFEYSGTKDWHRHDCRATTASMLYAAGADVAMCKKLLAHSERGEKVTRGYLRFGQHVPELLALGAKLEEVHRLQKDIEEGRDTEAVRKLCTDMSADPDLHDCLRELGMAPEEWLRIVPNPEHATAEVVPLRPTA